jgi:hypothetical protein
MIIWAKQIKKESSSMKYTVTYMFVCFSLSQNIMHAMDSQLGISSPMEIEIASCEQEIQERFQIAQQIFTEEIEKLKGRADNYQTIISDFYAHLSEQIDPNKAWSRPTGELFDIFVTIGHAKDLINQHTNKWTMLNTYKQGYHGLGQQVVQLKAKKEEVEKYYKDFAKESNDMLKEKEKVEQDYENLVGKSCEMATKYNELELTYNSKKSELASEKAKLIELVDKNIILASELEQTKERLSLLDLDKASLILEKNASEGHRQEFEKLCASCITTITNQDKEIEDLKNRILQCGLDIEDKEMTIKAFKGFLAACAIVIGIFFVGKFVVSRINFG